MFQRIQEYELMVGGGAWYRPRAYGEPQADGMWEGWLVFFPLGGGTAIATDRETTQTTHAALADWAAGLTPVYLEGALSRALQLAEQPSIVTRLDRGEYEALEGAARLEAAAEIERNLADLDDAAATAARNDTEQIRRQRRAAESALAATEETTANLEAAAHEQAARSARTIAADAARRRREANDDAARIDAKTASSEKKDDARNGRPQ